MRVAEGFTKVFGVYQNNLSNPTEDIRMEKRSITLMKPVAMAALGALLLVPLGRGVARAEGSDVTVTLSKLDISHGVGVEPIDQYDLVANFNNTEASESGKCEPSSDVPTTGFVVSLQEGACGTASVPATVTVPRLPKIGKTQYKFEGVTKEGVTVDATLSKLTTPKGSCGNWHLVLDATPIDLSSIQTNPVATSITLPDGSLGCLTATASIN